MGVVPPITKWVQLVLAMETVFATNANAINIGLENIANAKLVQSTRMQILHTYIHTACPSVNADSTSHNFILTYFLEITVGFAVAKIVVLVVVEYVLVAKDGQDLPAPVQILFAHRPGTTIFVPEMEFVNVVGQIKL